MNPRKLYIFRGIRPKWHVALRNGSHFSCMQGSFESFDHALEFALQYIKEQA